LGLILPEAVAPVAAERKAGETSPTSPETVRLVPPRSGETIDLTPEMVAAVTRDGDVPATVVVAAQDPEERAPAQS
jgi:hypothetical protein